MFHQLAQMVQALPGFPAPIAPAVISPDAADAVVSQLRPSQLSEYLELFWGTVRNPVRQTALGIPLGGVPADPDMAHRLVPAPAGLDELEITPPGGVPTPMPGPAGGVQWHHIVYSYMLENTRMFDIFRRVVWEWLHGEKLPTPRYVSQRWLHSTEHLFFRRPWAYSVWSVASDLRPDSGAVRRSAYYRLLGMDLNHGGDDGQGYSYAKADQANREFAVVFEALLAEVWRGYINATNVASQNLTDNNAIENLVRRLREMLRARRVAGALAREEFEAVALASWFHLTIRENTQVVQDLNATADGVSDRLKKIGERVGLPAHALSDSYFQLAEPMSTLLTAIEGDAIPVLANWPANLYLPAGAYNNEMLQIITHWSIATGRDVKDLSTRQTPGAVLATTGARPMLPAPMLPAPMQAGRVVAVVR